MKHSDPFTNVAAAFVKAQAVAESAKKEADNAQFKNAKGVPSKYATLESVFVAIRKGLASNELAVFQDVDGEFMTTRILHSSGEWLEGVVPLLIEKRTMQGLGSAMTYARRYGLMSAMGIATEDDDGNAASDEPPKKKVAQNKTAADNGYASDDGVAKTTLNADFQKFCTELGGCVEADHIDHIMKKYKKTLNQVKRDQPQTWVGTDDYPSVEDRVKRARAAAAFVAKCRDLFANSENQDDLNACFSDNKADIDKLPIIHKTAVETAMTVRDQELSGANNQYREGEHVPVSEFTNERARTPLMSDDKLCTPFEGGTP